jgi:nitrous oxidase accessory protein
MLELEIKNLSKMQFETFLIILFALLLFAVLPSLSYSKTLTVGVDYAIIGDALEKADDGDVIEVLSGQYKERLTIDKSVHIKGVDNPVISISNGNIVVISKPDVIFEGFTLTYDSKDLSSSDTAIRILKGASGTTVRNNQLLNVMFGIWNVESHDIRIENNIVTGIKGVGTHHRGNCINLTGSQNVYISGNSLSNCRDGIYMELCHDASVVNNEIRDSRYSVHTMWVDRGVFNNNTAHDNLVGLAIMYTEHSEINSNLSYGNRTHGLLFIQSVRSEIIGNTVVGNTKGIFLYNSVYNEITSNLVMNNQLGIHSWGGSEDNRINGNSFINNEVQVKYLAGKNQVWDSNYWSDYIGWDMTGDGKGDVHYESNTVVDFILWKFPLAKMLYTSPSLQMLWMLEKQFPVFEVPKVIDGQPAMSPLHVNWKELSDKYASYTPERIYGEIEKMPHMPGGHH